MTDQQAPFRDLKVDDVRNLIEDGYEIVDVREDWQWRRGHIP
jgi:rhodanese-related sulfurtransferase